MRERTKNAVQIHMHVRRFDGLYMLPYLGTYDTEAFRSHLGHPTMSDEALLAEPKVPC